MAKKAVYLGFWLTRFLFIGCIESILTVIKQSQLVAPSIKYVNTLNI